MQNYSSVLAEYFQRPPRKLGGDICGVAGSREQGARICFAADLRDGCLHHVGFRAFACPHIIAACNEVADQLEGAPVEALRDIATHELQLKFDIPVDKAGKLLILKDAVRACYADFQTRPGPS